MKSVLGILVVCSSPKQLFMNHRRAVTFSSSKKEPKRKSNANICPSVTLQIRRAHILCGNIYI